MSWKIDVQGCINDVRACIAGKVSAYEKAGDKTAANVTREIYRAVDAILIEAKRKAEVRNLYMEPRELKDFEIDFMAESIQWFLNYFRAGPGIALLKMEDSDVPWLKENIEETERQMAHIWPVLYGEPPENVS